MSAIVLEQVCKTFGTVSAADGLSLIVPTGSIYGFLGPNGAGKTTSLRMMMDIIRPDSGRIEVLGGPSESRRDGRISYMPEERGLYRKMKVGALLEYFASLKGVRSSEVRGRAAKWLSKVELSDRSGKKVEELSRGMQQKLQFAVAAVNEPELMILDEPFSGLDPVNLELLKSILHEIHDEGRTVIFSTHMMHEAEQLCDQIGLINKGRIVLEGSLDSIREGQSGGSLVVVLEGESEFVESSPMVDRVERNGKELTILLTDGGDDQLLLAELMRHGRVLKFEMKAPSLHEIFLRQVKA